MSRKETAKNLLYNSFIMTYYNKNVIDKQLENIYEIDDEQQFLKLYRHDNIDRLEGFNRNNSMYIGPLGTSHTIIHELLHNISSSFDRKGKRPLNGISEKKGFSNLLNEGLTDYFAVKISGEPERNGNYIIGVRFFRKLDEILETLYGTNNILFEAYITNNIYFLKQFINNFCTYKYNGKIVNYDDFIENFGFMDFKKIEELLKNIEKNSLKNKKKSILNLKPKTIDFSKNTELSIAGLIKKAYYDLYYFNPNYSEEDISKCMYELIYNSNPQYITNKRGVRSLIVSAINNYSLLQVVQNNLDMFEDIPINKFLKHNTK